MQRKSKLRNRRGDKIFINNDLIREKKGTQKKIRQKAEERRRRTRRILTKN